VLEGHVARRKATAARYHDLDEDPSCEHVVDEAVRRRVWRDDFVRATAPDVHGVDRIREPAAQ
jgi:hypothetical protein